MKKGPTEAEVKQANESLYSLAIGQTAPLTRARAFEILAEAPDAALETLNADYFEMECGKTYNLLFTGLHTTTIQGKQVEVAELENEAGEKFIHGSAVLVNACKKIQSMPCMIRVIVKDKKVKSKEGEYFDLTVKVF